MFLKGGGIVPIGPVIQHTSEAKHTDTITLLVALDEKGDYAFSAWFLNRTHQFFLDSILTSFFFWALKERLKESCMRMMVMALAINMESIYSHTMKPKSYQVTLKAKVVRL